MRVEQATDSKAPNPRSVPIQLTMRLHRCLHHTHHPFVDVITARLDIHNSDIGGRPCDPFSTPILSHIGLMLVSAPYEPHPEIAENKIEAAPNYSLAPKL